MPSPNLEAAVFDLDGVVTRTATVHAQAWKEAFDAFLDEYARRTGRHQRPFDAVSDYLAHVDGKPRRDGVVDFLVSRGIEPVPEDVDAIAADKNSRYLRLIEEMGVEVFQSTVSLIEELRRAGIKTAIASSSRNCEHILRVAGLSHLFDTRTDGTDLAKLRLPGKPAPDLFLEAARRLNVEPSKSAVVEDAVSGVEAGRRGGFGLVIGVARDDNREQLRAAGADWVVDDLKDIEPRELLNGHLANGATMSSAEWIIEFPGHIPDKEGHTEALCTLGNGFFATRGAAEEAEADGVHYPGTYVAGIYDNQASEVAGEIVFNEDLVNAPNWLAITFRPEGGHWLKLDEVEILEWNRRLDIREGLLHRTIKVKDAEGRITKVESTRLVHMSDPHLAGLSYRITPENWSGRIEVLSSLDGSVQNLGVARYRQLASKHLKVLDMGPVAPEGVFIHVETLQSRICIAMAARTRLFKNGEHLLCEGHIVEEDEHVSQLIAADVSKGETLEAQKIVSLHVTRDPGILAPDVAARLTMEWAPNLDDLIHTHVNEWASLWRRFDLEIVPRPECHDADHLQRILRLHIFHLLVTISENSGEHDVGVPARGIHGEAYRGHIFWDELFVFPFFDLRVPDITRSLLLYRYHRLDSARAIAREAEARGALFPWQSGSDGREVTQRIHLNPLSGQWKPDHSRLQRHVSLAIFYNVWQYWAVSGDRKFLERYAAEMGLEICRAFADLAHFNEASGRYEIHGVMGPDEYHEKYPGAAEGGLRNNAYTNVMVVWCMERALEILEIIRPARREYIMTKLRMDESELDRWRDMTRRMKVPFHGDRIISQFEGWDELEELDWEAYRAKHGTVLRLDRILRAEGDTPDRYKASKQADVTMLFYLLPDEDLERIFQNLGYDFDDDMITRNVRYYLPRSSHGSTLDLVVHAAVVDLIDRNRGWEMFGMALRADVEDIQGGTTAEGIHMGAMAGTVDITLRHYAGIDVTSDVLRVNPRLPDVLDGLRAKVHHRGVWVGLEVRHDWVHLSVEPGAPRPVTVEAWEKRHELTAGSELWIHHPEVGEPDAVEPDPSIRPQPV